MQQPPWEAHQSEQILFALSALKKSYMYPARQAFLKCHWKYLSTYMQVFQASFVETSGCMVQVSLQQKLSLLKLLVQHERERLETWARPLDQHASQVSVATSAWQQQAETAWTIDPRVALALLDRFALAHHPVSTQ